MTTLPILAFVVVLLVVLATQIFKILNEYERGVIFTFGRFRRQGPRPDHPDSAACSGWSRWTCVRSCSTSRRRM